MGNLARTWDVVYEKVRMSQAKCTFDWYWTSIKYQRMSIFEVTNTQKNKSLDFSIFYEVKILLRQLFEVFVILKSNQALFIIFCQTHLKV